MKSREVMGIFRERKEELVVGKMRCPLQILVGPCFQPMLTKCNSHVQSSIHLISRLESTTADTLFL